jgi:hypothetical protein
VVTAAPDGYTLGAVTSSAAILPVYGDTRFNYITALDPIAWISTIPQVLAVRADAPWRVRRPLEVGPGELPQAGHGDRRAGPGEEPEVERPLRPGAPRRFRHPG